MLAHAGTPSEQVALLLLTTGFWSGWASLSRIRRRGFLRLPLPVAWGGTVLAVGLVVGAVVLPSRVTTPISARPSTTATLSFEQPTPDERVTGTTLHIVLALQAGTILPSSTTRLQPNAGHIHLYLDGRLTSMAYGLSQDLDLSTIAAGPHVLSAEFVAADHAPFSPRVIATTTFVKEPS